MTVYSYGIMGEFRCEKSGGQSLRTADIKRAIWKKWASHALARMTWGPVWRELVS